MYPFLLRGASTSFFVGFLIAVETALVGCSGSTPPPPTTLKLATNEVGPIDKCSDGLEGAQSGKRNGNGVYRCDSELGPLFVTTLKDCSIPEKFTFQATTRQLLVGVMDLKVLSQTPVAFTSLKALHSVVHGTMDVDPFVMSIYTFHNNNCVTDLVVWKGSSNERPSESDVQRFSSVSSAIADRLVAKLVPFASSSNEESVGAKG